MNSGQAIVQALSRRILTADVWVRSHASPCRICGRHGTKIFFPEYSRFPLSDPFSSCYWFIQSFTYHPI